RAVACRIAEARNERLCRRRSRTRGKVSRPRPSSKPTALRAADERARAVEPVEARRSSQQIGEGHPAALAVAAPPAPVVVQVVRQPGILGELAESKRAEDLAVRLQKPALSAREALGQIAEAGELAEVGLAFLDVPGAVAVGVPVRQQGCLPSHPLPGFDLVLQPVDQRVDGPRAPGQACLGETRAFLSKLLDEMSLAP